MDRYDHVCCSNQIGNGTGVSDSTTFQREPCCWRSEWLVITVRVVLASLTCSRNTSIIMCTFPHEWVHHARRWGIGTPGSEVIIVSSSSAATWMRFCKWSLERAPKCGNDIISRRLDGGYDGCCAEWHKHNMTYYHVSLVDPNREVRNTFLAKPALCVFRPTLFFICTPFFLDLMLLCGLQGRVIGITCFVPHRPGLGRGATSLGTIWYSSPNSVSDYLWKVIEMLHISKRDVGTSSFQGCRAPRQAPWPVSSTGWRLFIVASLIEIVEINSRNSRYRRCSGQRQDAHIRT